MARKYISKEPPTLTNWMEKYDKYKVKYSDSVIFFRSNDFYECFKEDAVTLSNLLGITLTKYPNGCHQIMFKRDKLDEFLTKVVHAGHRVVICD